MHMEKKLFEVELNKEIYKVNVSFYGNNRSKKIIAFSQGYCYDSILYHDLFIELGKDHFIIAPEINGLRIEGFDSSNLENCKELFAKTIKKVIGRRKVFCAMGHSMGSNVCLGVDSEKTVLINPQVPAKENLFVFLGRGIPTLIKEMNTKKSGKFRLKVVYDYFKNFTSNICNNLKYMNSIRTKSFEDLFQKNNRKTLLITSTDNGSDGFFKYDKKKFMKTFNDIRFVNLPGTHSKILYGSDDFAENILKFLK